MTTQLDPYQAYQAMRGLFPSQRGTLIYTGDDGLTHSFVTGNNSVVAPMYGGTVAYVMVGVTDAPWTEICTFDQVVSFTPEV